MTNILLVSKSQEQSLSLRLACMSEGFSLTVNLPPDEKVDAVLVDLDGIDKDQSTLVDQLVAEGVPVLTIGEDVCGDAVLNDGRSPVVAKPVESFAILHMVRQMLMNRSGAVAAK